MGGAQPVGEAGSLRTTQRGGLAAARRQAPIQALGVAQADQRAAGLAVVLFGLCQPGGKRLNIS